MHIKAIETRYAGCLFRSRLEARWAVFFRHVGIGGGPATEAERTLSRFGGQTGGLGACQPWRAGLS